MKKLFLLLALASLFPIAIFGKQTVVFDGKVRLSEPYALVCGRTDAGYRVAVEQAGASSVYVFTVAGGGVKTASPEDFAGLFFRSVPGYARGVALWRYKPYNAWTKPVKVNRIGDIETDDVQCFYWQYDDGVYAVAAPLCGNGYRTTLGNDNGCFGSKAVVNLAGYAVGDYPAMTVGFGRDIYRLFSDVYRTTLEYMGRGENLASKKSLPAQFDYLGWCTWNALGGGPKHTAQSILQGLESFAKAGINLGYLLIDDGWLDVQDRTLVNCTPNPVKYPDGLKAFVDQAKRVSGIRSVGVWHALNGYWNGIAKGSPIWEEYKQDMFSWTQNNTPRDAKLHECWYFKPDSPSLYDFWDKWYAYLSSCGVDMVKVDNQSCPERISRENYPIDSLAEAMHKAVYRAAFKYFKGALINCMAMNSGAFYNYGNSAVARSSEDYFPYTPGETYDLQKGNAAAHITQALYNALYFSQMVYCDMDMFQTHNPNAEMHAVARVMNNGPVYVTDIPGKQNFAILRKMALPDGRLARSTTPVLPCEESLFMVQDKGLFKAFSFVGGTGIVGAFNMADADRVSGSLSPADAHGIEGDKFAVYDYFAGRLNIVGRNEKIPVSLPRMGYKLFYVIPYDGFAPIGLLDLYNAPATVSKVARPSANTYVVSLPTGGRFACATSHEPKRISANGKPCKYTFRDGILVTSVAGRSECEITVEF